MSEGTYERELTPLEIHERRLNRDELDDAIDGVRADIAENKREIKELQVEESRLDARIRQLRWEIKTGKVTLPRQAALPLDRVTLGDRDGMPVEDPRERPKNSRMAEDALAETADTLLERPDFGQPRSNRFDELYPMATSTAGILMQIAEALGESHYHGTEVIAQWAPNSDVFMSVAHWARVARATIDGQKRAQAGEPGIPGLFIPTARMPAELEAVLKKPKRQRKAKT